MGFRGVAPAIARRAEGDARPPPIPTRRRSPCRDAVRSPTGTGNGSSRKRRTSSGASPA